MVGDTLTALWGLAEARPIGRSGWGGGGVLLRWKESERPT